MSDEYFADLINAGNTPFAKLLGIHIKLARKDRVEAEMLVRDDMCTIPATIHGGALMSFADNVGATGAFLNLPPDTMTSTVESKTNFIRPIKCGEKAFAVAVPVNIGRTLQVWETRITRQDGKLAGIVVQ